ncbi:hypothetical protein [Paenalcaligenes hominis]
MKTNLTATQRGLITLAVSLVFILLVLPLLLIFSQAFSQGLSGFWQALTHS